MGPTERDVAWALAGMVPRGGKFFTAERDHIDIYNQVTADRGTTIIPTTEEDVENVTPLDLTGQGFHNAVLR